MPIGSNNVRNFQTLMRDLLQLSGRGTPTVVDKWAEKRILELNAARWRKKRSGNSADEACIRGAGE